MKTARVSVMGENAVELYPRDLRPKEKDLLEAVLPEQRPGYRAYRQLISTIQVIGEGRRGPGNVVLGKAAEKPDLSSPLGPVVAYGALETTRDVFSVSVRELGESQLDVEIVSTHGDAVPDHYEERRRWTYSTWSPGTPSPNTGERAREVRVDARFVLAILARERRLLLHDADSGMNHLLPVTGFYGELMAFKNIREPGIALHSDLLFRNIGAYTDDELRKSLVSYNRIRHRVPLAEPASAQEQKRVLSVLLKKLFWKKEQ